jgi:hypothetical protein
MGGARGRAVHKPSEHQTSSEVTVASSFSAKAEDDVGGNL